MIFFDYVPCFSMPDVQGFLQGSTRGSFVGDHRVAEVVDAEAQLDEVLILDHIQSRHDELGAVCADEKGSQDAGEKKQGELGGSPCGDVMRCWQTADHFLFQRSTRPHLFHSVSRMLPSLSKFVATIVPRAVFVPTPIIFRLT